jgi:hypothetical protein
MKFPGRWIAIGDFLKWSRSVTATLRGHDTPTTCCCQMLGSSMSRPQTHPMSAFTSKTHQQRTLLAGECHPEGGRLPKRGRGSAASAGAFKLRPRGSVASCRRAVCARKVKRPRLNSMPHDQASKSLSGNTCSPSPTMLRRSTPAAAMTAGGHSNSHVPTP